MIKITNLSPLHHQEALLLYSDVLEAIGQDKSFSPVLHDLHAAFAACVSAYDSASHPPSGHHLTVELARLDVLRVREVRYLLYYLKSFLSVPEPDNREAARLPPIRFSISFAKCSTPWPLSTAKRLSSPLPGGSISW